MLYPKTQRQKKTPKPLRRTPINRGSRCKDCSGVGLVNRKLHGSLWERINCVTCNGTGRVRSKPIKRSTKPIERSIDEAAFDHRVLNGIWNGASLPFPVASGDLLEFHHILGRRGGDKIMSSPYNGLPLPRTLHSQGWINWPEARGLFLKLARRRVNAAMKAGLYQPSLDEQDRDAGFLDYSQTFLPSF
ncbi:MAG: hypothetical protein AB7O68_17005 [Pirellulales bacterium]